MKISEFEDDNAKAIEYFNMRIDAVIAKTLLELLKDNLDITFRIEHGK